MTATHCCAIDSTQTVADNLRVRRTEANAYTRVARTSDQKVGVRIPPGAPSLVRTLSPTKLGYQSPLGAY
jgi:hypothetical protein